jgi:hypothetical protein
MNKPEKTVLFFFLSIIIISSTGAGLVYRNQVLRNERNSAIWGSWQTPCSPMVRSVEQKTARGGTMEDGPSHLLQDPEAAERIRDELDRAGLELTSLKRVSRPGGIDFIIETGGTIKGILRFLEILPQILPGWCFCDLSLRRRSLSYTLEITVGDRFGLINRPEDAGSVRLAKHRAVDLERQLFSFFPHGEGAVTGNPAHLGVAQSYAAPPAWLAFSGVEKNENQTLAYLFFDNRTGRVHRITPEQTSGDWILSAGSSGWILRIGQSEYFLGGL